MAYQVLARRWRPQRFDQVVGQEHVTKTLTNAIRAGRLAHGFLFCGPRGVGKTTTARILAKCLNCEKAVDGPIVEPCNECGACEEIGEGRSLDVLEIDGASNRGIDEIRDLRENVRYAPSGGRAKVYIIDEVHMLTKEAFNALLKTLEEPPPAVYFVFATTEGHKVPATIRSRCQRYDFRRISSPVLVSALENLAKSEKFELEPLVLEEIARHADGGLRDAQSLLDQAAAVGEGTITLESLRELLGDAEEEAYLALVAAMAARECGQVFERLQELLDRGMDPSRVSVSLSQTLRDLLVVQTAEKSAKSLGVREDLVQEYRKVGEQLSPDKLTALLALSSRTVSDLRRSARPRLTLEVALARMCRLEDPGEMAALVARVEGLRSPGGGSGGPGPAAPAAGPAPTGPGGKRADTEALESQASRSGEVAAQSRKASPAAREGSSSAEPGVVRAEARAGASVPTASAAPTTSAATVPEGPSGQVWSSLLDRVRARKMMLASFLGHGTPVAMEDGALTAVFENDYYEGMVMRRENLAIIHEELAGVTGEKLAFRAKVGAAPGGAPAQAKPPSSDAPTKKDLLRDNPGLSRIVHDLGGQLLPGGGSMSGGGG